MPSMIGPWKELDTPQWEEDNLVPGNPIDNAVLIEWLLMWYKSIYLQRPCELRVPLCIGTVAYQVGQPPMIGLYKDLAGVIYLLIRGTYTFTDLYYGIWMWKTPTLLPGPSHAHSGYQSIAALCLPEVISHLSVYGAERVVLCGHSMGGVIAILLAQHLYIRGIDVSCLSIGIPPFTSMEDHSYPFPIFIVLHMEDPIRSVLWGYYTQNVVFAEHLDTENHPHHLRTYFVSAFFDRYRTEPLVEDLDDIIVL